MTGTLEQIAKTAGGFAAGYLLYIAVGGLLGLLLAKPFRFAAPAPECWPLTDEVHMVVTVDCESSLADAVWYGVVEIPNTQFMQPAMALTMASNPTGPRYVFATVIRVGMYNVRAGAAFVSLMSLLGFLAWRTRSPLTAWTLALFFVGEIATMAF